MRVALSMMLRILSFLSIEPGKQPLDQLNRRLRNRYVSVLPHADRGARYTHDLGKDRLGKLEPMPDGHKEGRLHVTIRHRLKLSQAILAKIVGESLSRCRMVTRRAGSM